MGVDKGDSPDQLGLKALDREGEWRMVILGRKLWCKEGNGLHLLVGQ